MKVRHKETGIELEVEEGTAHYVTPGMSCISKCDPAFEIVPEEEWKDVTESCHFYAGNEAMTGTAGLLFVHRGGSVYGDEVITEGKGYRFTKIDGLHHGPAFIVERRKES